MGSFHSTSPRSATEDVQLTCSWPRPDVNFALRSELHEAANVKSAVDFLQALIEAVPYTIRIVLTENGIQFRDMPSRRPPVARHRLHMLTASAASIVSSTASQTEPSLDQRSGRADEPHPQKPVRRYHYETHQQLREHLEAFLNAYNFAKRLKTLRGLTPVRAHLQSLGRPDEAIQIDPTHLTSGLNS